MRTLVDGLGVLGCWVQRTGVPEPTRAHPLTSSFGEDGVGYQDGGTRGRQYTLAGGLEGPGALGLATAQRTIRNLADGKTHIVTDSLGTAWPNVLLSSFTPTGRAYQSGDGTWFQGFQVTLTHLT